MKYRNGKESVFPHIMDRAKPGAIGVLVDGKRFVNEALGYHDYTLAMVEQVPEGDEVCSWLIADARYMKYYPLGMAKPLPIPMLPYLRSGYLTRAATIRELAAKIGVDPDGLDKTVTVFNEHARAVRIPSSVAVPHRSASDPVTPTTLGPTPLWHRWRGGLSTP